MYTVVTYGTGIFGAMLADSFLGKFKTILYMSILYFLGQCMLSFGAIPGDPQYDGIKGNPNEYGRKTNP